MPTVRVPLEDQPEFDGHPALTALDRVALMLFSPFMAVINLVKFPLLIRRTNRHRLAFLHEPVSADEWSMVTPGDREYFDAVERQLISAGFSPAVHQLSRDKDGIALIALQFNPRDVTVAAITRSRVSRRFETSTVGFQTWLTDGTLVTTSNDDTPGYRLARSPGLRLEALPETTDVAVVHAVHRARCRELFDRGLAPIQFSGSANEFPVDLVRHATEANFGYRIAAGYYEAPDPDGYSRPTIKGAVLHTWPRLPPFVYVLTWLARRRGTALLARYA